MLVSLVVALSALGLGHLVFGRWTKDRDAAAQAGLNGILGLGLLGWITLPIGLISGGLKWGVALIGLLAVAGLFGLFKNRPKFSVPKGPTALALLGIVVAGLIALVGVLAPSDSYDWDSLAYHLALPKMWIAAGRITFVTFIHHSNFPYVADGLFIWGESWGGQAGAKLFMLAYAAYGTIAIFGLARERYSAVAGWWSALAFATVPMVIWESGTAYIDVVHALFGGIGIWLASGLLRESGEDTQNHNWVLPALFLGGAVATKYTGLQTLPLVGFTLLGWAFVRRAVAPLAVVKMGLFALVIASPWYIKNFVNTGNPVYPFFYSKFGGKNWDAYGERIYRDQQQTFGAGRPLSNDYTKGPLEPLRAGSSILGLAYMPGRYADPAPWQGAGFPFVSLGAIPLIALLGALISGRLQRPEAACLVVSLLGFAAWFVLSQQARYVLVAAVPLLIMTGGLVVRAGFGRILAGAVAVQALGSLWVLTRSSDRFTEKLRVVLGTTSREDYEKQTIGFAEPAKYLNEVAKGGKVALYDEVFGFLLDVPYFWANPGHTTEMGYAQMHSADDLVAALRRMGITHVYLALGTTFGGDEEKATRWLSAAGLGDAQKTPFTPEERKAYFDDPGFPGPIYRLLLAEAVADGKLQLLQAYGRPTRARMVFELVP